MFIASAAASCLCSSPISRAQTGKVRRIGYLDPGAASIADPPRAMQLAAFHAAMRELGHLEGRDYALERKFAEGKNELYPKLSAELVESRVDLIIAAGGAASRAARQATATIPIVFVAVSDPVSLGLVARLARPGGNATGRTAIASELDGKRIELLREVVPALGSVAVLMTTPVGPSHAEGLAQVEAAARRFGVRVYASQVRSADGMDAILAQIQSQRPGGLIVLDQTVTLGARERIVEFARRSRIAAVYQSSGWVERGGLMSYGASFVDEYRRTALYVDKIFKGMKPADLPVEQPVTFELVVNQKTAKALGLTLPQSILLRTDRLIE